MKKLWFQVMRDGVYFIERAHSEKDVLDVTDIEPIDFDSPAAVLRLIKNLMSTWNSTFHDFFVEMESVIKMYYKEDGEDGEDLNTRIAAIEKAVHELRHRMDGLDAPINPNS